MNSIFSFLQPSEELPAGETAPEAAPAAPGEEEAAQPAAALSAGVPAAPLGLLPPAPTLDMAQVLQDMLAQLNPFLHTPPGGVPAPALAILSLNDAPVGLGNFIGSQGKNPIGFQDIRGGRLSAVVRFDLWDSGIPQLNAAVLQLQGDLLTARAALWNVGFLTFKALTSTGPEFDSGVNAFHRSADYELLYEYQYIDTDAAQSLIARIPVHADQEVVDSLPRENTLVTDEMVRWDDLNAPAMRLRGPTTFRNLSALAFAATAIPSGPVTLLRSYEGVTDPVTDFPSLADFLTALADSSNPSRHARVVFPDLTSFLAEFTPAGTPLSMGDWDLNGVTDEYLELNRELTPPIQLKASIDRLEVIYANGSDPFDQAAVIYLKLK